MSETIFRRIRGRIIPIRVGAQNEKQNGGNPAVTIPAGSAVSVGGGYLAGRSQHTAGLFEHAKRTYTLKGATRKAREAGRHLKTFSKQAAWLRTGSAAAGAALIGSGVNELLKKNETMKKNETLRFLTAGAVATAAFFGTRLGYYAHLHKQATILKTLNGAAKSAALRMFIKP